MDANQSDECITIDTADQSEIANPENGGNSRSESYSKISDSKMAAPDSVTGQSYRIGNSIPTNFLYLPPTSLQPANQNQLVPTGDQSEMGYLAQLGAKRAQKKESQRNADGFFPCECKFISTDIWSI